MIEPENLDRYRRELRAMCDKAANDPIAFAQVSMLLNLAMQQMHLSIAELRHNGYSDSDIGRELGVTRQAVRQRYPRRRP